MNRYEKMKKKTKAIYPVNDTLLGYRYWVKTLAEKAIGMTKISGLEPYPWLHEKEIQMDLIIKGHTGIFNHSEYGLISNSGSLGGRPDPFYHPTLYIYSQPALGSGNLAIGKDCAVIYNSYTDIPYASGDDFTVYGSRGLLPTIQRYAALLADIESSITILTVNRRATGFPVASTEPLAKSVDNMYTALRSGEFKCINENSILESFKVLPFDNGSRDSLTELYNLKRMVLKSYLEEIGVRTAVEKRERLITDEVATENQLLIINVDDMVSCQQEGFDVCNQLFGTDIHVSIDPDYDPRLIDEDTSDETDEEEVEVNE